jgi:hypothetical protein
MPKKFVELGYGLQKLKKHEKSKFKKENNLKTSQICKKRKIF